MFLGESPLGQGIYDLDPNTYLNVITEQNRAWHDTLRGLLGFIDPYSPYALAVVGSDGRFERHEKRGTDIIVIADSANEYPDWDLRTYLGEYGFMLEDRDLNIYDLSSNARLSVVQGLRNAKAFPDYLLNSDHIAGDIRLWTTARERVLNELQDPKLYKDIRERNRKEYAKAARTGIYAGVPVFNVADGLQFYQDEGTAKLQLGFKVPFLRLVQSWLDLKTTDYLKHFEFDPNLIQTLSRHMPTSTSDRLCFLGQHGGIGERWEDVYQAYGWFLREYHYAQEQYTVQGYIESPFNKEEFEYCSNILQSECVYHS